MGRPKGSKNKKNVPTWEGEEKGSATQWSKREVLSLAKGWVAKTRNLMQT